MKKILIIIMTSIENLTIALSFLTLTNVCERGRMERGVIVKKKGKDRKHMKHFVGQLSKG